MNCINKSRCSVWWSGGAGGLASKCNGNPLRTTLCGSHYVVYTASSYKEVSNGPSVNNVKSKAIDIVDWRCHPRLRKFHISLDDYPQASHEAALYSR